MHAKKNIECTTGPEVVWYVMLVGTTWIFSGVKPGASITWGEQAQYEIANEILRQFNDLENTSQMNDEQLEALAIRLSEPAVDVLKRKSPRTTSFDITVTQLRNQLESMDLQSYDDDIMGAAVEGINLVANSVPAEKVIRQKLWKEIMPDDAFD